MRMYVGVTDYDWYTILKDANCDEINFWKPGSKSSFKAINTNDLFLFKLHSPRNYIVGGGLFVRYSVLPTFLAWDAFGIRNGTNNLKELDERVYKYKKRNGIDLASNNIGCIILTEPFFFEQKNWIPVPENWNNSIVQGKTYTTDDQIGSRLYEMIKERLRITYPIDDENAMLIMPNQQYGNEQIIKPRLGQGSFRVLVTEAYNRSCAITGERTLPVLDAAHIKPYAEEGPHAISNGLLLRTDLHALFDKGYVTIDDSYRINVSHRLHEDYGNGKIYYEYHGRKLLVLPSLISDLPSKQYLHWHNEQVFLG